MNLGDSGIRQEVKSRWTPDFGFSQRVCDGDVIKRTLKEEEFCEDDNEFSSRLS